MSKINFIKALIALIIDFEDCRETRGGEDTLSEFLEWLKEYWIRHDIF